MNVKKKLDELEKRVNHRPVSLPMRPNITHDSSNILQQLADLGVISSDPPPDDLTDDELKSYLGKVDG